MARKTVPPMEWSKGSRMELPMARQMVRTKDLLWDQMTETQTEPRKGARSQPL
jgi:hypothetical protein